MPIFRFIILGLAIWIAIQIIRRLYRNRTPRNPPAPDRYLETVACQQCGVHIPREQALTQDKLYYCSPQHRDAEGRR